MTTIATKEIEKALSSKGFEGQESHHHMFWFKHDGKKTSIRTRLSHGIAEYGDNLLGQMAKQLHLSKGQLVEFVSCTLSEQQYREQLIAKKHLVASTPAATPSSKVAVKVPKQGKPRG